MNNKINRTELVFILDRSGSMSGLEADTIGGYNSMLENQKNEPGEATVTTVLFDTYAELLHDRIPIQGVAPITQREYYVRGCTALLDAVGMAIQKISAVQLHTAPELRADKVLFVITTDGYENASREYSYEKLRGLVERKKAEGWEFLFLGANIDAIGTAARFGISADRAANYHADSQGTAVNFAAVSEAASNLRHNRPMAGWKKSIDADFTSRKSSR
ncbi:MAG: VWA domain-containing protein [Oscillospiraceae bacterium]|nr:VWA domain-containing protein [Oscillospiraceae bacterium]